MDSFDQAVRRSTAHILAKQEVKRITFQRVTRFLRGKMPLFLSRYGYLWPPRVDTCGLFA